MIDSWEYRLGRMRVQHSQIELDERVKLSNAGYPCMMDKFFCTEGTTPDYYFVPPLEVAAYLDGPVHKGKHLDWDDYIRDKIVKQRQVKRVISIPYKSRSQLTIDALFEKLVNQLSFGEKGSVREECDRKWEC